MKLTNLEKHPSSASWEVGHLLHKEKKERGGPNPNPSTAAATPCEPPQPSPLSSVVHAEPEPSVPSTQNSTRTPVSSTPREAGLPASLLYDPSRACTCLHRSRVALQECEPPVRAVVALHTGEPPVRAAFCFLAEPPSRFVLGLRCWESVTLRLGLVEQMSRHDSSDSTDRSQPDYLSVSSGYATDQFVLGAEVRAIASWRATRSDRGEP
ncbi:hypothetical protein E6C27_scaffold157G00960 [Cucumis melo var. makuwa]|uniref:Uncharacterized protein n=1 Tax=Cucumis melo var. makuwa TaxID=1194695 RepID=A0A5A7TRF9_CUCMM|nr:hypothetical protein E6C27_scaffold157G00960 [Cucumis melo var. makuwa]